MLVVQFFNQLKQVVVHLGLVTLRYLLLLLLVHVHLRSEHRLSISLSLLARRSAHAPTCALKLLQGSLRQHCRHHASIRSLLFDGDYDFTILATFLLKFISSRVVRISWGVRLRVQIGVLLGLVLHFKLSEKCLFEFGLLGRADRLASHLLHIELIE